LWATFNDFISNLCRKALLNYAWLGNVRELANVIERAIVMESGTKIAAEHLCIEHNTPNPYAQINPAHRWPIKVYISQARRPE
jgi:DNA-binding NtrC family response regulator